MSHEIVMPQLGLSMTEGTVISWLKSVGDRVEKGESLFSVETDKVEMDVESSGAGYVSEILVNAGQAVAVGTVIALLSEEPQGPRT
jgi:pyruvate/2-oxoglutarate dehydrogenase complex dihydrolipoamide acyltransferase (E2) component